MEQCHITHAACAFLAPKEPKSAFPWPERDAAYKGLRKWAKIHAQRDEVIRAAVAAGIDQRSIQQITGIARTTIARIVQSN